VVEGAGVYYGCPGFSWPDHDTAFRCTSSRRRASAGGSHDAEARALVALVPNAPYGHAPLGFVGYERGELPQAARHLTRATSSIRRTQT